MKKIKKFIIDGKNFHDLRGFYDEVVKVLTNNFKGFGRNYDAFDDILYGGEEPFEFKEKITLIWRSFEKSRKELPKEFLENILEIIKNHKFHIKFKIEK